MTFTIVILTHNRRKSLAELLKHLGRLSTAVLEVIVVDNASDDGTTEMIRTFPDVVYLRNEDNEGAVGRNRGMIAASGDIVITLDDDIFGLDLESLQSISRAFEKSPSVAALNFRVVDYYTGELCNWVHHRPSSMAAQQFATYEITEGAVAFRRAALEQVGFYWNRFFIGHEGPDLAFRLMDAGYTVCYEGLLVVRHKHETGGRLSWRFYYYDTRNQIWLAVRRMRLRMACRYLFMGLTSMAVYSFRDGFFWWYCKALVHALHDVRSVWKTRRPMTLATEMAVRQIDRARPPFWRQVRKRLFQSANRLDG